MNKVAIKVAIDELNVQQSLVYYVPCVCLLMRVAIFVFI